MFGIEQKCREFLSKRGTGRALVVEGRLWQYKEWNRMGRGWSQADKTGCDWIIK